ncbi:hypothetical protein RHMOL_Rhmol03G0073300 [Rhododendron molle]|uniref:Uncharacterized protein n=1 Tax=Rhododendron molle TaxID=49168 RepID=A0ACC0PCL7_RHOML|nr:hypothetical protein RHMOL_Rhmol03G0073300 [Rhododendron molle]
MWEKDCCDHHKCQYGRLVRRFLAGLLVLLFILLVVFLITWAVLQPKKPQFVLQDATVYALNVSALNFVSSSISLTISSQNPNDNIGVYYDKLDVYATYQDQQITYYTAIPPTYQGHHDVNVWSPYIVGTNVPVAPYNGLSLNQDAADGSIVLFIKIIGRVRWKVGTITTGNYHFDVTCPALITFAMISPKKLVKMARKWQKAAAIKRKRISYERDHGDVYSSASTSSSSVVDKGHFVVYTADQRRGPFCSLHSRSKAFCLPYIVS